MAAVGMGKQNLRDPSNRHIYCDILLGSEYLLPRYLARGHGLVRVSLDEGGLGFKQALNFSGLPKDLLGITAHLSKTELTEGLIKFSQLGYLEAVNFK